MYYLSTEKSDLVYEIKCKENLEFQNLTLSNDEIIERFEKIIKNNLGQRKLIISYKEKDEKDKVQVDGDVDQQVTGVERHGAEVE